MLGDYILGTRKLENILTVRLLHYQIVKYPRVVSTGSRRGL